MPINRAFAPFFEGDKGDRRVTGLVRVMSCSTRIALN